MFATCVTEENTSLASVSPCPAVSVTADEQTKPASPAAYTAKVSPRGCCDFMLEATPLKVDEDFQQSYCEWESKMYYWISADNHGFFQTTDNPNAFNWPASFANFLWRMYIHFECLYFGSNKTLWDFTFLPLVLCISRMVSGIFQVKAVKAGQNGYSRDGYFAHGFYGWGKLLMCQPEDARDRLMSELANLSIVAALFLTITIPILIDPPEGIVLMVGKDEQYSDHVIREGWFIFMTSVAVCGQLATTVIALSVMTNLNKCVGPDAHIHFILSIFNPSNGLTGLIGLGLYLGAILSWSMTFWVIFLITFAVYHNDDSEATIYAPMIYLAVLLYTFGIYLVAVMKGIVAENKCSAPELKRIADLSKQDRGLVDHFLKYRLKSAGVTYTQNFSGIDVSIDTDTKLNDDQKAILKTLLLEG